MQTTLTAFFEANHPADNFLPKVDDAHPASDTRKRHRDEQDYVASYPGPACMTRATASQLWHLQRHRWGLLLARPQHRNRHLPWSAFPPGTVPLVRTLAPSIHATRHNADGEALVSTADTFRNCVTSTEWDARDELLLACRRSGFQLFGAAAWTDTAGAPRGSSAPLVELSTATVQARVGGENRMSFGLSAAHFMGSTLNTICGYSGAPTLDVFDLEDLDETAGTPLHTYDMRELQFERHAGQQSSAPAATAVFSLSDSVAVAALGNGCTALIDTRRRHPLLCTEAALPSAIISGLSSSTRRGAAAAAVTAVAAVDRSDAVQLLTGTKSGAVALWDLRKRNEHVATCSVGGAIEALHVGVPSALRRRGVQLAWLNTDSGDIVALSIGASSFAETARVSTGDCRRSQVSASVPPPKISMMPLFDRLIYPHIASNTILIYNTTSHVCGGEKDTFEGKAHQRAGVERRLPRPAAVNDFTTAAAMLKENSPNSSDNEEGNRCHDLPLSVSTPFSEWSYQLCSASASRQHSVFCVGGDDGDLHVCADVTQAGLSES